MSYRPVPVALFCTAGPVCIAEQCCDRHRVTGWSIKSDPKSNGMIYDISFKRLPNQPSMDSVLRRPWVEEIEDYKEYKRLRQVARDQQASGARLKKDEIQPLLTSGDATMEIFEDKTADSPISAMSPVNDTPDLAERRNAVPPTATAAQQIPQQPPRRNALGDVTSVQQNVEGMRSSSLQVDTPMVRSADVSPGERVYQ